MILATTPTISGKEIVSYCGIIRAEVIFGGNVLKDLFANSTDFSGSRSGSYEKVFADARIKAQEVLEERARADQGASVVRKIFTHCEGSN